LDPAFELSPLSLPVCNINKAKYNHQPVAKPRVTEVSCLSSLRYAQGQALSAAKDLCGRLARSKARTQDDRHSLQMSNAQWSVSNLIPDSFN